MMILEILFWLSVFAVAYIYLGYPILIGLLAKVFQRPIKKAPYQTSCSVILSCYNEAEKLGEKIRQVLALEGSDLITEILIGSDGSTDSPESVLAEIGDDRIHLHAFEDRRGKPSVLNDLIGQARGDILLMMDVRQKWSEQAIPSLLRNFSDEKVGAVSGELIFVRSLDDTGAAVGIDTYWRYEKWIRKCESAYNSVPGATGAIYAIRRSAVRAMPPNMVLDDVILPMFAVSKGFRCIFEPDSIAYDVPVKQVKSEGVRKRRTISGCIQLLFRYPAWWLPFGCDISWQYGSHKILRVFSPFFIILAIFASIMLMDNELYRGLLVLQAVLLVAGLLGWFMSKKRVRIPILGVFGMFLALQVSVLQAWCDFVTGNIGAAWDVSGTQGLSETNK